MALLRNTDKYISPNFNVPTNACDCHVHVFDSKRFAFDEKRVYTPDYAPLSALISHLNQLQIHRVVLVQPSPYGTNNECMLDALKKLGKDFARGVAVINDSIKDNELRAFHKAGIRGVRLNFQTYGNVNLKNATDQLKRIANRIKPFGWHLQIYTTLETVSQLKETLSNLSVPLVLDHYCCFKPQNRLQQHDLLDLLNLLSKGNVYLKMSAPYRISESEDFSEIRSFVEKLIAKHPENLLWGSDWPHTMPASGNKRVREGIERFRPEDDGYALNIMAEWLSDSKMIETILVHNPTRLYWA